MIDDMQERETFVAEEALRCCKRADLQLAQTCGGMVQSAAQSKLKEHAVEVSPPTGTRTLMRSSCFLLVQCIIVAL